MSFESIDAGAANTSDQVAQVQTSVDTLGASIASLQGAISTVQAQLSTIPSDVRAQLSSQHHWYGGLFGSSDLENYLVVAGPSQHVEVWGLLVSGGNANGTFTLRSLPDGATMNADPSETTALRNMDNNYDITLARPIGPTLAPVAAQPGGNLSPLWRTADGCSLVLQRSAASAWALVEVWYEVVSN